MSIPVIPAPMGRQPLAKYYKVRNEDVLSRHHSVFLSVFA